VFRQSKRAVQSWSVLFEGGGMQSEYGVGISMDFISVTVAVDLSVSGLADYGEGGKPQ